MPLIGAAQVSSSDFAEAQRRFWVLRARDDARILTMARSACYHHGHKTDLVVVLFHGFTNNPIQFERLAGQLWSLGANVLVPRLPGHGDADRMTTRLGDVSARQFVDAANEAVEIARGLGRQVVVAGISLGATLAAWLAITRNDIHRCISIAPTLAIDHLPYALSSLAVWGLTATPPDQYQWWDSKLKERTVPHHAYPRYPMRTLGVCFLIGEWVFSAPGPFPGRGRTRVTFVINPLDQAVNNGVVADLASRWRDAGMLDAVVEPIEGLPQMHDIIDPEQRRQHIKLVYPKLVELITSAT